MSVLVHTSLGNSRLETVQARGKPISAGIEFVVLLTSHQSVAG